MAVSKKYYVILAAIILAAIILSLSSVFYVNIKFTPRSVFAPSYEKVAFELLNDLQAENYDKIESFFEEAHKNKTLTVAGREYMASVFERWYYSHHYIDQAFLLPVINGWQMRYPNSPFPLLARASYNYNLAWRKRGGGYIHQVSAVQQKEYYDKLTEAYADISKVFTMDDSIPYAYELAVKILSQYADEHYRNKAKELTEAAQEKNLYDVHGIKRSYMLFALSPKWGGNSAVLLDYARTEANNASQGSLALELIPYAHLLITETLSPSEKKKYFTRPEIWNEIEKSYTAIIKTHPDAAVWMLGYAMAAYAAGDNNKTAELLNQAAETDPYYSRTFYDAGKIYMNPATYDMAEKSYRRYIELVPYDDEPYRQLAYIKIEQKQYNEAIALADTGIALDPSNCFLWSHRCLAHFRNNQLSEALNDCNKAISVNQACSSAYLNRSEVYAAMGDKEKSAEDYSMFKQTK